MADPNNAASPTGFGTKREGLQFDPERYISGTDLEGQLREGRLVDVIKGREEYLHPSFRHYLPDHLDDVLSRLNSGLEDPVNKYHTHLKERLGDDYKEMHGASFRTFDDPKFAKLLDVAVRDEVALEMARKIALNAIEIEDGAEVRAFYEKKENAAHLDRRISEKFARAGVQVSGVGEIARMIAKHKGSLKQALQGRSETELGQLMQQYAQLVSPDVQNSTTYDHVLGRHLGDNPASHKGFLDYLAAGTAPYGVVPTPSMPVKRALALHSRLVSGERPDPDADYAKHLIPLEKAA